MRQFNQMYIYLHTTPSSTGKNLYCILLIT